MTVRQHKSPVLLSAAITTENDVVYARQRARQIAAALGFHTLDQTALATAVSEIARNALQYGGGGRVEFAVDVANVPQFFWIDITDKGPGIHNLDAVLRGEHQSATGMGIGMIGSRRLTERFGVESSRAGTSVAFGKSISNSHVLRTADLGRIAGSLAQQSPPTISDRKSVV